MTTETEPKAARRGRPPAAEAGVAEARVLDAATALFLDQGYGRTTLDLVAASAGVGKSSVYGRFGDKQTLFEAVVRRSIETMFAQSAPREPAMQGEERLRHLGIALADSLLVPRCVSLMRMVAAEASAMPDLAAMAYRVSYEGSVGLVTGALEQATLPPGLDRAQAARRFLELALQPLSFQAAFGGELAALRDRAASDVEDALTFLRARGVTFADRA